jgi:hypothetical protein
MQRVNKKARFERAFCCLFGRTNYVSNILSCLFGSAAIATQESVEPATFSFQSTLTVGDP